MLAELLSQYESAQAQVGRLVYELSELTRLHLSSPFGGVNGTVLYTRTEVSSYLVTLKRRHGSLRDTDKTAYDGLIGELEEERWADVRAR